MGEEDGHRVFASHNVAGLHHQLLQRRLCLGQAGLVEQSADGGPSYRWAAQLAASHAVGAGSLLHDMTVACDVASGRPDPPR